MKLFSLKRKLVYQCFCGEMRDNMPDMFLHLEVTHKIEPDEARKLMK